jgi:hypothetical protein
MANRIQLRRDTQANWNRVNPILEDGEPGLDITTNQIKYGDGSSTWTELAYAGGSGSVSFDYSTVQEGAAGPIGVTSITGDPGVGVSLTSDEWAQLMWTPNTANVTINTISTGGNVYNWAYVDDSGFNVENDNGTNNRQWKFTTTGNLTLPSGGKILESTYFSANSIIIKPSSGTSTQYLEIAPTAVDGNHIHLMAGSGTELFLGDDNHYVKLANTGGVVINSNDGSGNTAQWNFSITGNLILPQTNMQSSPAPTSWPGITFSDGTFQKTAAIGNTLVNGAYTVSLGNTGILTLPVNGRIQTVGNTSSATLQWLPTDGDGSTSTSVYVSATGVSIETDAPGNENTWVFGTDGTLTTPGNVTIGSGYGNISQIDTIFANNYVYANGVSILSNIGGTASTGNIVFNGTDISLDAGTIAVGGVLTVTPNLEGQAYLQLPNDISANITNTRLWNRIGNVEIGSGKSGAGGGVHVWYFNSDGSTVFPDHGNVSITGNLTVGNLTVNGNITYINTETYIVADNIPQFAVDNPADTLDLGFVAHRTVGSALQHTGLIRDASAGNWKLFSNVAAQPGSTVDFTDVIYDDLVVGNITSPTIDSLITNANVNIASYLPTYTGAITASNLRINRASPSVSTGGTGDLRGTITADTNYLYYAVDTYGNGTYSVILATSNNGSVFYHDIVKGDYPEPKAGWSMSVSGSVLLVESVTDGGSYWRLNSNTSTTYSAGASANLTGNSSTVWKSIPLQSFQTGAYGNTQVASYLTTYTGNIGNVLTTANVITSGYFIGDGSLLTNIASGGGSTYSNANVASYLPTYSGNITAANVWTTGPATGIGALSVGPALFTPLPNTIAQFTGNANSYVQINFENISSGSDATADYIATANNGTDTTFFVDLGIANSNYDVNSPSNSLGTTIFPNDSYLYAQGNLATTTGGNLAIGTSTAGKTVKIFAGGINSGNIVATVSNTGVTVTGNITASGNVVANTIVGAVANANTTITAGTFTTTFDTVGNVTAQGNVVASYLFGNGAFLTGVVTSGGSSTYTNANVATFLASFGSNTISTTGNVTVGNVIGNAIGTTATYTGNVNAAYFVTTGGFGNITQVDTITANNGVFSGNISGNTAGFSIGYRDIPQVAAGNVTLALSDAGKHYYSTASSVTTLTVPANGTVGFPIGTAITIVNQGTGNILVANAATVTMYLAGNATAITNRTITTFGMATLLKVATNTWFINGTGVV